MNILQVVADVHGAGLDHVLGLRNTDPLQLDASLGLNLLHEHLGLARVKSDASAASTCTSRATTSMNVGLSLLGWLNLDDQVHVGDVKTTRGDISGDKDAELAFLEALHRYLTLVLSNVTVHDFDVLLDLVRQEQRVGISLRLSEDNDLATLSINDQDVSKRGQTVLEWALNSQMLHVPCRLVLELDSQVNDAHILVHVSGGDVSHPPWDSGGEKQNL